MGGSQDRKSEEAKLRANLEAGEEVIWIGCSRGRFFRASPAFAILWTAACLLFSFFAFFLLLLAEPSAGTNWYLGYLVMAVFTAASVILLLLPWLPTLLPRLPSLMGRERLYFITNRRVGRIDRRRDKRDQVMAIPLESVNRLQAKVYPDGSGNLVYRAETGFLAVGWRIIQDVEDVEVAVRHLATLTDIEPRIRKNLFLGISDCMHVCFVRCLANGISSSRPSSSYGLPSLRQRPVFGNHP